MSPVDFIEKWKNKGEVDGVTDLIKDMSVSKKEKPHAPRLTTL